MVDELDPQIILIVDDTPTNLEVLSEALTSAGFQVAVALDGESAIEQVEYHPPSLILLDVMMPGIDGFETCRRLKADSRTQDIPVIFMTALSEAEHKVRGLNSGAVDYITKPFQQEEVLARVKVHLQIRSLTQKLEEKNALLEHLNETLEQKVIERTEKLQQAQVQLIQQEKLSSLGQLVAGVAHEINNPVNFIYGNFPPAKGYIQDLLDLIDLYQGWCEPPLQIQNKINEIDLDFVRLDLPKLLDSMQLGADRIREIVVSLRNFSRLDEAEFKTVDLHQGIDNTLMILGHRLKAKPNHSEIEVIKEYEELPLVTCFPGQLNQVFMNLLANAIDALEQNQSDYKDSHFLPSIKISTKLLSPDWVSIRIADNGAGIPVEFLQKIFDPFFTTKPIGKGTGLGLSISHQIIVEKHQGRLFCYTNPGQGTEFVIEIPVAQPEPQAERFAVIEKG